MQALGATMEVLVELGVHITEILNNQAAKPLPVKILLIGRLHFCRCGEEVVRIAVVIVVVEAMGIRDLVKLRPQGRGEVLYSRWVISPAAVEDENHRILARLAVNALGVGGEATAVPEVVRNGPCLQIILGFEDSPS